MFRHSTNTASFFSVPIVALILSLSLAGVAAAQGNTSLGTGALQNNTTGSFNTAIGQDALFSNSTGVSNTAIGEQALEQRNGFVVERCERLVKQKQRGRMEERSSNGEPLPHAA